MQLVYPYLDKEPNDGADRRNEGRKPRITVEKPPLIVYSSAGVYTMDIREWIWIQEIRNGRNIILVCNTDWKSGGYDVPGSPDSERSRSDRSRRYTRNSIKLLNHFEIQTPMTSYHEFNKYEKGKKLVEKLLDGMNIAVITDAGTPGISDPGEELVKMCYEQEKSSSCRGAVLHV